VARRVRRPERRRDRETQAVIEARGDAGHETDEQLNDEVVKILAALRSNGYEPTLRIEDIE
jgi:hypothetical protein